MKLFECLPQESVRVLLTMATYRISQDLGLVLCEDLLDAGGCANEELYRAERVEEFRHSNGYTDYNPRLNDPELFQLVALLYLGRLFKDPVKAEDCLRSGPGITEDDVVAIVDASTAAMSSLQQPPVASSAKAALGKLVCSHYFTRDPKQFDETASPTLNLLAHRIKALIGEGSPQASLLAEKLSTLRGAIREIHEQGFGCMERSSKGFSRETFFSLKARDAARLVASIKSSQLLYDLISLLPPTYSTEICHQQAVYSCVEHARLWLLGSTLPISYNFPELRYCDVGETTKNTQFLESDVGFLADLPSALERWFRRTTLRNLWRQSREGVVACNLTPADFEAAGRGDTLLKWLPFPVILGKGERSSQHALAIAKNDYLHNLLYHEPNRKLEALELRRQAAA